MSTDPMNFPKHTPSGSAWNKSPENDSFPVVGIGASAGGLEAFLQLLEHLPEQTGMAFVLVQHLDPTHESQLVKLLSQATSLPVSVAAEGLAVARDQVYVIPHGTNMAIERGVLRLTPRSETCGQHLPVDVFFRSLALDRHAKAVGVVLSGTGSDGTLGLAEIKAAGGLTFAQDQASAKYAEMPRSAVHSGLVDFILTPEEIARELARLGRHPYFGPPPIPSGEQAGVGDRKSFRRILALLRSAFGVDFSQYRETTIRRRIMRRMVLRPLGTLAEYARQLEENRSELEALYEDVLINVTNFFRDPEMFDALTRSVFPEILKTKSPGSPIRVWSAGCSTGQEAYSLAMALVEFLEDKPQAPEIQIFGTDLSDAVSLAKARAGHYPESIEREISPERLRRFFRKESDGYRIAKSMRDLCVFAKHNVATDPPFSRLDLLSCRNVLIYLSAPLQKRIIPTFHYALNPTGFLLLGSSETVGGFSDQFTGGGFLDQFDVMDKQHKIYRKNSTSHKVYPQFSADRYLSRDSAGKDASDHFPMPADWQKEADRVVVGQYAPVGVLVNGRLEVMQFRGRTSPYLEPPSGEANFSLLKMAREGLFGELRAGISEAREKNATAQRTGVRVWDEGQVRVVDLTIIPLKLSSAVETCFLVLFEEPRPATGGEAPVGGASPRGMTRREGGLLRTWFRKLWPNAAGHRGHLSTTAGPAAWPADEEMEQLRRELAATREHQQAILEQQDAANEELRSANEEVLSSNEELQSTNEELETAKEELQSMNEELTTANEQLQNRNVEMGRLNDDLSNFLTSAEIPIVMTGADLRIRRLTPAAENLLNFQTEDIGRSLADSRLAVDVPELQSWMLEVIETFRPKSQEVRDREGRWHTLRIHPYRTSDNQIAGVVVALLDIDEVKRVQNELRDATDYAEAIVGTVREPLVVLDKDLRVHTANQSFYRTFHVSPDETEQWWIYELGNGQWDIPELRVFLQDIGGGRETIEDFEVQYEFPRIGPRTMLLNARRLVQKGGKRELILLAIDDVTQQRRAELALKEADRHKDEFLAMLAHELRNPLAAVSSAVELLGLSGGEEHLAWGREIIGRQTKLLVRLVDDLLDISRITRGTISLRREVLDATAVIDRAVETVSPLMDAQRHELQVSRPEEPLWLVGDPIRLEQVLVNLLTNAAKYTETGGHIQLTAEREGGRLVIAVRDNGIGISAELLPQVFELFSQAEWSSDRVAGGLGIGLALVRSILELHGGSIEAKSDGLGQGSEFTVRLPALQGDTIRESPHLQSAPAAVDAPARRVLVVDDNRDAALMLSRLLETAGHQVQSAHDGPAALEAAAAFRPDAVLLDIGLPGLDGCEVARRLRQEPSLTDVLLIAISGYCQEEDRRRMREAGFHHQLVKPADHQVLLALLAELEATDKTRLDAAPMEKSSYRILIIDDMRHVAEVSQVLLREQGHEVRLADDGPSGMEAAQEFRPQVVLCDISLPGTMDGYAVAQALSADPAMGEMLLIAVTAHAEAEHERRALQAGFHLKLTKPIDFQELERIIANTANRLP